MSLRWYSIVVDCRDIAAQAAWWAETLGWVIAYQAPDEVWVVSPPMAAADIGGLSPHQRGPGLEFVTAPEGKSVKNRLHIDLAPGPDDDQAALVAALVARGAGQVDIGQGEQSWVVLADPEGNEFCVLSPRD